MAVRLLHLSSDAVIHLREVEAAEALYSALVLAEVELFELGQYHI